MATQSTADQLRQELENANRDEARLTEDKKKAERELDRAGQEVIKHEAIVAGIDQQLLQIKQKRDQDRSKMERMLEEEAKEKR